MVAISDGIEDLAASCEVNEDIESIADALIESGSSAQIIVGTMAQMDPNYSLLVSLASIIGNITDAKNGRLEEGNAVAAWQASFLPFAQDKADAKPGKNAAEMLDQPLKACLLFNIEPSQDSLAGNQALKTLRDTGMVVSLSNYRSAEIEDIAHVMLPLAATAETDGSHVNCEGVMQSWTAAVHPLAE